MKILGQEVEVLKNQLLALILNIYSWFLRRFFPFLLSKNPAPTSDEVCVAITGPGGMEKLRHMDLPKGSIATIGYNLPGLKPPYATTSMAMADIYAADHVLVKTSHFSVNYADVTIRWGLYESALRYVGYPIVPGFDFSGTVLWAGPSSGFAEGDEVFGCTLFGAYSSRILVPGRQIRRIPRGLSLEVAAALPAVAGTALHAVSLAGAWPNDRLLTSNTAVLIHSAAGTHTVYHSPASIVLSASCTQSVST
jgi:synaptic vesicle membrane protein VAT-1